MKKPLLLIITIVFTVFSVYSQSVKTFKLDKMYTKRKIKKNNAIPYMYEVVYKSFNINKGTRRKIITPVYKDLVNQIKLTIPDSIAGMAEYQTKLDKYNDINTIKNKIVAFENSNKPFDLRKKYLIEAQNLAQKHTIDQLIYADAIINKEKKSKFLVLSLNKFDLKVHLKKVLWNLDPLLKKPQEIELASTKHLAELRKKLKNTKKYSYVSGKDKKLTYNGFFITKKIMSPQFIEGTFSVFKDNYVVLNKNYNNFIKNQLIDINLTIKNKITSNDLQGGGEKTLIKNKQTNKMYLVNTDFVIDYAFTINGTFKLSSK